jgi:TonB family protein
MERSEHLARVRLFGLTRARAVALRVASLAAAFSAGSCVDNVHPVLGELKIGSPPTRSFVIPSLFNDRLPFEYPESAWRRGIWGETVLRIHISEFGAVDAVLVDTPSSDRALDSAAVAGARLLTYRPADMEMTQ